MVAVVRLRGVLSARSGIMNSYQSAILCDWDGARAQYSNFLHEESVAHRAASVFSRFPIFFPWCPLKQFTSCCRCVWRRYTTMTDNGNWYTVSEAMR